MSRTSEGTAIDEGRGLAVRRRARSSSRWPAVVYWVLSEEPAGTVALAFTAGLAFLIGYYLLFTARRIDPRPEDHGRRRDRGRRR